MSTNHPRRCLKCRHPNPDSSGAVDEACPKCGAIYSRVEAYLKERGGRSEAQEDDDAQRSSGVPSRLPKARSLRTSTRLADPSFVSTMRSESLYPTLRSLVKLVQWFLYFLAGAVVIGMVIAFKAVGAAGFFGSLVGAVALIIAGTAFKEASIMLADLADAAVISASRAASASPAVQSEQSRF